MSGPWLNGRRKALLAAFGAAVVDVAAVAVLWRVDTLRRALLSALGGGSGKPPCCGFDPYEVQERARTVGGSSLAFHAFAAFEVEARVLALGGAVLCVLAIAAMVLGIRQARRRGALAALAVVAPSAILGVAGLGTLVGAYAYLSRFVHMPCFGLERAERQRYATVAAHAGVYHTAGLAILAVAILSTIAVVALVRRVPASPVAWSRPRPLVVPAAVFALGLTAFALTRAQAADLRSPMPFVPGDHRSWLPAEQVAALPPAYRCDSAWAAPFVVLEARGLFVDDIAVPDLAELSRVLVAKRELWRLVQPNKPFPGVGGVAIPASTKLASVRPLIAAVRAAGYPIVEVLEARATTRWKSRTLGEVATLPRVCTVVIEANRDLPRAETWGEMVRALASDP